MRNKYQERAKEVLPGTVVKVETINREDRYDIIKLIYDDGTSVQINSSGSLSSTLEVTERS